MPPVAAHKDHCQTAADAIAARDAVLARRKAFFAPSHAPKPVVVADPKWIAALPPITPVEPIKFPSLRGAFKVQFYIGPEYQIELSLDFERPKIREIQNVVCKVFDIKRMDLLSQRRTRAVVFPRQVAMYLAKTLTLCSLPEIGRCFGGRDHTTVLHAVRKIEGLIQTDAPLARQVGLVRAALFLDGRGR